MKYILTSFEVSHFFMVPGIHFVMMNQCAFHVEDEKVNAFIFGYYMHRSFDHVRVYSYRTVVAGCRYCSFLCFFFFFFPAQKK